MNIISTKGSSSEKKACLLALRIAYTFNALTLVHQAVLRAEML